MSDILEELSAARRRDAEDAERQLPLGEVMRRLEGAPGPRDFAAAFRGEGVHVIAELKKASPSEGLIREDFRPVELAKGFEAAGAAALSVLCEPHRFLGGVDYLKAARAEVKIPVLFKDFVTTPYQVAAARLAGADAVLLIAAVLDDASLASLLAQARSLGFAALVETHTAEEIDRAVAAGADVIGVNCRDLRTFKTDPAITASLIGTIPSRCVRIAESGIRTAEDISMLRAAGADGFLIGTTLMRAPDPAAKLGAMIGQ
jgi:indole-3-glycerol phosphate synthase